MVAQPSSNTKKDLRTYFKSLRAGFTQLELQAMDQRMLQHFSKIPLKKKSLNYALSYKPLTFLNEVDTHLFDQYLSKEGIPDLGITYPRTNLQTLEMEAVVADEWTAFIQNTLNLSEPDKGIVVSPTKIDLVLLPLLTFDTRGNRVGYGKGFYDRYLGRCRPDVLKIGLSYLPPVPQIVDVNHFDIPLDFCVTPDRLYEFNKQ